MFSNTLWNLWNVLGLIPEIILLVASITYLKKQCGPDAMLMTVGASLMVLSTIVWCAVDLLRGLFAEGSADPHTFFQMLSYASTVVDLVFLAGLFLFVSKLQPRMQAG